MQFSCGQCSTRYSVPDEKVRGKRIRTKCRKCGAEIIVDGPGAVPSTPPKSPDSVPGSARMPTGAGGAPARMPTGAGGAPARMPTGAGGAPARMPTGAGARRALIGKTLIGTAPPAPPAGPMFPPQPGAPPAQPQPPAPARPEDKWTVAIDRATQKKMTTSELVDAYASGQVNDTTLVWKQGMAGWEPPFSVPAVALALRARGLEPKSASSPKGAAPAAPAAAPKAAPAPEAKRDAGAPAPASWDDENEATRVVDGSLPFLKARAEPRPPSVAKAELASEDESTRIFSAGSLPGPAAAPASKAPPLPARPAPAPQGKPLPPPPAPKPPPAAVPPPPAAIAAPAAAAAPSPGPAAPSSPSASDFSFDDEATAVIAPDRARELLEAEVAKGGAKDTETPLGFAFDDEATQVVTTDKAAKLLSSTDENKRDTARPPAGGKEPAFPSVTPAAGVPAYDDPRRSKPGTVEEGPSVVLAPASASPAAAKTEGQKSSSAPPPAKDLATIQHEKTRVIRAVKKKGTGTFFWIALVLALVVAAIGGVVASHVIEGRELPAWLRLR